MSEYYTVSEFAEITGKDPGNYRNWRKRSGIWKENPKLMKALLHMSNDLKDIYGDYLVKIVLYGSYARGEQTEESDVDIAVILQEGNTEKMHDDMVDVVVDYELDQGVTLSVITIEIEHFSENRFFNTGRQIFIQKASETIPPPSPPKYRDATSSTLQFR